MVDHRGEVDRKRGHRRLDAQQRPRPRGRPGTEFEHAGVPSGEKWRHLHGHVVVEAADHGEDAGVAVVAVRSCGGAGLDEPADVLLEADEQRPRFGRRRQLPAPVGVLGHDVGDGEGGQREFDGAFGEVRPRRDLGGGAGLPAPQCLEQPAAQRPANAPDEGDGVGQAGGGAGRTVLPAGCGARSSIGGVVWVMGPVSQTTGYRGIGTLYVFRRT